METPEFQEVYADVRDDGVQFLGLNVKETSEQFALAFVDRFGIEFPSLYDPRGEVALAFRDYPANAIPSTIVLDRESRVAAVYTGEVAQEDLRRVIDRVLGGGLTWGRPSPASSPTARCSWPPAVAALVGLISFASPCVLPLVPGYLSYVTGLVGTGDAAPADAAPAPGGRRPRCAPTSPRGRAWCSARCCSCSASPLVFVAFGAAFGGLGRLMLQHADVLNRVFGVDHDRSSGLGFLGWLPLLQRTKRISARPAAGLAGAPLLGIVFGLGWTPCLGPDAVGGLLAGLLRGDGRARARCSGVAYCLGLGVPFVLVALGARWAMGATSFLRRHARTVTRVGGAVLVLVGLLLLTGAWTEMMQWLRSWLAATGFGESAL